MISRIFSSVAPGTFEAAVAFRKNKDASYVEKIVMGIIDRHLEPDQREILANSDDMLRMYEDLGMDSLTMLEIVMLVEQTLEVSIDNEELRDLRTVGDAKAYLHAKAKGEEPPFRAKTYRIEEIAALMPHREPFLFLESVSINGDEALGSYRISGNEYFFGRSLQGKSGFFPASIMIEALGQLCVFFLLKGENAALKEKVDPNTIFFTSCDGVKCRRICKPGDAFDESQGWPDPSPAGLFPGRNHGEQGEDFDRGGNQVGLRLLPGDRWAGFRRSQTGGHSERQGSRFGGIRDQRSRGEEGRNGSTLRQIRLG